MALQLTLRNNVWQVTGTVTLPTGERRRVRRSTGYTKHQKQYAEAHLGTVLQDLLQGKTLEQTERTVKDVIDFYLGKPVSVGKTDRITLGRFVKNFGERPIGSLTVAEIIEDVQGRGNKANTIAREINSLNAAFAYARQNGVNIPDGLRLKRPSVDDSRTRWLDSAERDRLIEHCNPKIRRVVSFLFFTGTRLGEAFDLTWRDVREDSVFVSTRKGKNKSRRTRSIPLNPRALSAVGAMPKDAGLDDFVFPNSSGGKWLRQHFYPHWHRACREAGIRDFRPHDCRHTFASLLVQRGVGLREVADLLGHTQLTMVMRYSHLSPSHLKDAVSHLKFLTIRSADTHKPVPTRRERESLRSLN
jgi:integrase